MNRTAAKSPTAADAAMAKGLWGPRLGREHSISSFHGRVGLGLSAENKCRSVVPDMARAPGPLPGLGSDILLCRSLNPHPNERPLHSDSPVPLCLAWLPDSLTIGLLSAEILHGDVKARWWV
jgi:hypothetical protein